MIFQTSMIMFHVRGVSLNKKKQRKPITFGKAGGQQTLNSILRILKTHYKETEDKKRSKPFDVYRSFLRQKKS